MTATFTDSPTSTVTPQYGPGEVPGLTKSLVAPVPAYIGKPMSLYTPKALLRSHWRVFNVVGELAAELDLGPGEKWTPTTVAPGIYFFDLQMTFADNSTDRRTQKVSILSAPGRSILINR